MADSHPTPPPDSIFDCLSYDRETGIFTWKTALKGIFAGTVAGTTDDKGYVLITFSGRRYKAHRLAWYFETGIWPVDVVDHRNGVKSDNSIANLRQATKSQNGANAGMWRNNTSGMKGIRLHRGKWLVRLCAQGREMYIGSYADVEAAKAAYRSAAEKHFGEFARVDTGEPCRVFVEGVE